ncbi:hypothetical protein BCR37DRAFT_57114 [Protomyces lactucae-debilis]|uniref:Uncharacterized protein n=1 Tax=Protomyces lactucae-debilis TaxID=2754530 RepID=A0A1Y2FC32_PROLT|nr:uncharacterized protein BCR37DRAFT_57114 [Protomyces lactucae-debilis]ORY80886.1 hypothetical protein BCR37DRAFT_57114 [Protomyces lactucae-debilis]
MLDLHNSQDAAPPSKRKNRLTRLFTRRRAEPPDSLFVQTPADQQPSSHGGKLGTDVSVMPRPSMSTTPSLAFSLRSRESLSTVEDLRLSSTISTATAQALQQVERDPESRYHSLPSASSSNPSEPRFVFDRIWAASPNLSSESFAAVPRTVTTTTPAAAGSGSTVGEHHAMMQVLQQAMTAHSESRLARAAQAASSAQVSTTVTASPRLGRSSAQEWGQQSPTMMAASTFEPATLGVRRVRTWTGGSNLSPPVLMSSRDTARYARMPLPAVPQGVRPIQQQATALGMVGSIVQSAPATPTRRVTVVKKIRRSSAAKQAMAGRMEERRQSTPVPEHRT